KKRTRKIILEAPKEAKKEQEPQKDYKRQTSSAPSDRPPSNDCNSLQRTIEKTISSDNTPRSSDATAHGTSADDADDLADDANFETVLQNQLINNDFGRSDDADDLCRYQSSRAVDDVHGVGGQACGSEPGHNRNGRTGDTDQLVGESSSAPSAPSE